MLLQVTDNCAVTNTTTFELIFKLDCTNDEKGWTDARPWSQHTHTQALKLEHKNFDIAVDHSRYMMCKLCATAHVKALTRRPLKKVQCFTSIAMG
mmetsp:Transcript_39523/g.47960  ORF Transcript_39523/g.47960 Transcript_39523/m.47960 type:complete len:95 (-) Transcript_39523:1011-1295(-)